MLGIQPRSRGQRKQGLNCRTKLEQSQTTRRQNPNGDGPLGDRSLPRSRNGLGGSSGYIADCCCKLSLTHAPPR